MLTGTINLIAPPKRQQCSWEYLRTFLYSWAKDNEWWLDITTDAKAPNQLKMYHWYVIWKTWKRNHIPHLPPMQWCHNGYHCFLLRGATEKVFSGVNNVILPVGKPPEHTGIFMDIQICMSPCFGIGLGTTTLLVPICPSSHPFAALFCLSCPVTTSFCPPRPPFCSLSPSEFPLLSLYLVRSSQTIYMSCNDGWNLFLMVPFCFVSMLCLIIRWKLHGISRFSEISIVQYSPHSCGYYCITVS